ncbi:unnamed protein product, partial [Polarella glacialis]
MATKPPDRARIALFESPGAARCEQSWGQGVEAGGSPSHSAEGVKSLKSSTTRSGTNEAAKSDMGPLCIPRLSTPLLVGYGLFCHVYWQPRGDEPAADSREPLRSLRCVDRALIPGDVVRRCDLEAGQGHDRGGRDRDGMGMVVGTEVTLDFVILGEEAGSVHPVFNFEMNSCGPFALALKATFHALSENAGHDSSLDSTGLHSTEMTADVLGRPQSRRLDLASSFKRSLEFTASGGHVEVLPVDSTTLRIQLRLGRVQSWEEDLRDQRDGRDAVGSPNPGIPELTPAVDCVLTQRKQRTADKPPTQTDYFLPGCHSCSSKRGRRVITFKPVSSGCDVWGWLQTVLSLRGRSMLHMMPPFLLVMVMTVTRALAMETTLFGGRRWDLPDLKGDGYSLLMVPLSFLLVYRLNRAAVRFYDSRAAVGKLIECCRNLASEAATFCAHDPEARDEVCRWLVAFPVATRNYLRAETPDPLLDLQGVLSLADAQALLRAPVQTLFCCDRIRQAVLRATRSNNIDNPVLAASMFGRME